MSTSLTAKDKFGFSNKEITAFLIAYRERISILKKTRPWLYENLPAVLGISKRKWTAKRTLRRILFGNRSVQILRNITYCQIGKRAISNVIMDIIRDCGKTEQEQIAALEKIKEAIAFFQPIPNLQPSNTAGKIDELHKEWADKQTFQEVKRIKDHLGISYKD